ncbi:MAG: hypothetical protein HQK76_20460 [Desulfobacterales bacterium]|nr:hypothetical protein [Desulfobacterales bacterium]
MPLYWPLQTKKGDVSVMIDCTLYRDNDNKITLSSHKSNKYKVTFYGFFITKPIEEKLALTYEDAIQDIVRQIVNDKRMLSLADVSKNITYSSNLVKLNNKKVEKPTENKVVKPTESEVDKKSDSSAQAVPIVSPSFAYNPLNSLTSQLKVNIEPIIKDFEIRILTDPNPNKEYPIVIGTFVDADTKKTNKFSKEMEIVFLEVILDRFRNKQNIKIFERKDLGRIEEQVAQETNEIHFIQNEWQKMLGQKPLAGFIIIGDISLRSNYFKVRAKLVNMVSGDIIASSGTEIPIFNIEPKLIEDYSIPIGKPK